MVIGALGAVGGTLATTKWEIDSKYYDWDGSRSATAPYSFSLSGSKYYPINSGNPAMAASRCWTRRPRTSKKAPEAVILHMANPVVSLPQQRRSSTDAYKKLKFMVVLSPWLSETADLFADVVLPAATVEKYEGPNSAPDAYIDAVTIRTPPMEPLFQSRGEIDIYLDLMDRLGRTERRRRVPRPRERGLRARGRARDPARREAHGARDPRPLREGPGIEEGIGYFEKNPTYVKGELTPRSATGTRSIRRSAASCTASTASVCSLSADDAGEGRRRDLLAGLHGAADLAAADHGLSPPEYDLYLISHKLWSTSKGGRASSPFSRS